MNISNELIVLVAIALVVWLFGIALGVWICMRTTTSKTRSKASTKTHNKVVEAVENRTGVAIAHLTARVNMFIQTAAELRSIISIKEIEMAVNRIQNEWIEENANEWLNVDLKSLQPIQIAGIRNGMAVVIYDYQIQKRIKR